MKVLDKKGIMALQATIIGTVVTAVVIGTPLAVDEIDVEPDHPLYLVEKVGEEIKAQFIGGQKWEIDRAVERTSEYMGLKEEGLSSAKLIRESQAHILNAAKVEEISPANLKPIVVITSSEANLMESVAPKAPVVVVKGEGARLKVANEAPFKVKKFVKRETFKITVIPSGREKLKFRVFEKPKPGEHVHIYLNRKAKAGELLILNQYMELRDYREDLNQAKEALARILYNIVKFFMEKTGIPLPPFFDWISERGFVCGILESNYENIASLPFVDEVIGVEVGLSKAILTPEMIKLPVTIENLIISFENAPENIVVVPTG